MRAALAVLVLTLAACGTTPARYGEGAACTTALFLGPQIGFPIALACGLHEVHKEIAAEEADKPAPKRKAKPTPPPVVEEDEPEEDEPEDGEEGSRFDDKGNDEEGGIRV